MCCSTRLSEKRFLQYMYCAIFRFNHPTQRVLQLYRCLLRADMSKSHMPVLLELDSPDSNASLETLSPSFVHEGNDMVCPHEDRSALAILALLCSSVSLWRYRTAATSFGAILPAGNMKLSKGLKTSTAASPSTRLLDSASVVTL